VALWALGFVRASLRARTGGCGSGSSLSEEEEEEKKIREMLAGVEDSALIADCNIDADEYDDLFGHQHEFLENLSGRSISPLTICGFTLQ
jgi:hypothetical protein